MADHVIIGTMVDGIDRPSLGDEVARVAFGFFELDTPKPDRRWFGAAGWADGLAAVEVRCSVLGVELWIDTDRGTPEAQLPNELRRRIAVADVLTKYLVDEGFYVHVPWTASIEAFDCTVLVDQDPVVFHCYGVNDGAWVGTARFSRATITLKAFGHLVVSSLRVGLPGAVEQN